MASVDEARALLRALDGLRQQVEALEDAGQPDLLKLLKLVREEAEAVLARAESEVARQRSGVGAAPRYRRGR